jgi:serine/threonine-protein kinase
VTPEDVDRAARLLAPFIGPIGRVVARRAAAACANRNDFFAEVALSLETPSQRERFLRDAAAPGG